MGGRTEWKERPLPKLLREIGTFVTRLEFTPIRYKCIDEDGNGVMVRKVCQVLTVENSCFHSIKQSLCQNSPLKLAAVVCSTELLVCIL